MLKVLEVAFSQVGYLEKASNKQLDDFTENAGNKNYTKYARDINLIKDYFNGNKQGAAWCAVFVNWCFIEAYGADVAKVLTYQPNKSLGAGCKYAMNYYKNNKALFDTPEVGDQIFFGSNGSISHTGIVTAVIDGKVHTIEGNKSNKVGEWTYDITDKSIVGYGRPNYSAWEGGKTVTVNLKQLSKGCRGEQVQSLQQLLIAKGYPCGKYGDDGDFGNATKEAVIAYQKDNPECGKADGIVGEKTWKSILGA